MYSGSKSGKCGFSQAGHYMGNTENIAVVAEAARDITICFTSSSQRCTYIVQYVKHCACQYPGDATTYYLYQLPGPPYYCSTGYCGAAVVSPPPAPPQPPPQPPSQCHSTCPQSLAEVGVMDEAWRHIDQPPGSYCDPPNVGGPGSFNMRFSTTIGAAPSYTVPGTMQNTGHTFDGSKW